MKLSPDHRRFLLVEQVVGGGVVNLAIAALLSWLLLRHAERVPVTGSQGVVVDTIASAFMIPFATCLIVTRIVRRQVRRGRIAVLDGGVLCAFMPRSILWRAILMAFVCAAAISPIIVAACTSLGANSVSVQHFLLFKLGFAGAEGALITPLIAFVAISRQDYPLSEGHRRSTGVACSGSSSR
jgi:hypothetical protein